MSNVSRSSLSQCNRGPWGNVCLCVCICVCVCVWGGGGVRGGSGGVSCPGWV